MSLQSVLGAQKKSSRTEPRATGLQTSRVSDHHRKTDALSVLEPVGM